MGFRGRIARPLVNRIERRIRHWAARPLECQQRYFRLLLATAPQTTYGRAMRIESGMNYAAYCDCVPLVDYEDLKPYVERIMAGEPDVLWPGKPDYLAMSSGTTSGKKYIPATPQGMQAMIRGMTDAFCSYIARSQHYDIWDGKTLPLTGSPALTMMGEIPSARVSGLMNHVLPWYARWNRVPSWETNSIADFERKISRILDETIGQDVRALTGLPVWLNFLFKRLRERTGKKVIDVWPHLNVMLYGGLQVAPYTAGLCEAIGKDIDFVEIYNGSEGFFAFADQLDDPGLLLHMRTGCFYEFMPAEAYRAGKVERLQLQDVDLDVDYGLVLNSVSGLWGYNLGDTVRFTSREPYRLVFTGRLAHFTSAFNEHVIQVDVERAMQEAIEQEGGVVTEFTVAPQIHPETGPPYHEWFVEFAEPPNNLEAFRLKLDSVMQGGNHLYREMVAARAMRSLKLSLLQPDGFLQYMKSIGQVGEQHKVPRLKNDRSIADAVAPYVTRRVG